MVQSVTEKNKKKILWISILQGFTMLLVVMGHSDLAEKQTIPAVGLFYQFFKSFRMPLFILISGYLFYLTRLSKDKEYSFVVIDKLKRLGIPFAFFTILGFGAKILASAYIKHPLENMNWTFFTGVLLGLNDSPLGALWFVYVTFFLMLLYPLYKIIINNRVLILVFLCIGVVLNFFPIPIEMLKIHKVSKLFVFFFVGIVIGKYKIDKYAIPNLKRLLLLIVSYFVLFVLYYNRFFPIPQLVISLWGVVMSFHIAKYAEKNIPTLFQSFRYNTYQIYLISVFPQMAIEMLYRQLGSQFFLVFCIANIFIGLYFPIIIVRLVERYNLKYLKPCIGL